MPLVPTCREKDKEKYFVEDNELNLIFSSIIIKSKQNK